MSRAYRSYAEVMAGLGVNVIGTLKLGVEPGGFGPSVGSGNVKRCRMCKRSFWEAGGEWICDSCSPRPQGFKFSDGNPSASDLIRDGFAMISDE